MTFSQIPLAQQDFQNTVGFLKQVWVFLFVGLLKTKMTMTLILTACLL